MSWQCWVRKPVKFLCARPAVIRYEGLLAPRKGPAADPVFGSSVWKLRTQGQAQMPKGERSAASPPFSGAAPASEGAPGAGWEPCAHSCHFPETSSALPVRGWCHHLHPHLCPRRELPLEPLPGSGASVSSSHTHNPLLRKAFRSTLKQVQAARHGTLVYCCLPCRNNQAASFLKPSEECECPLGEKIKDKNKLQNPGVEVKYTKVSKWHFFFRGS